jgi:acyl-CoA synthetase (AMP-forming)/AMP-acid ligase II
MLVETASMQRELKLTPGLRLAALVPLHHSFGFGDCALAGILAGAEVCTYSRMPPSGYLSAFERSAIDVVALVPAQLRLLAEKCNAPVFGNLSALSGGAPLDGHTAQLARERIGCAVGQVYGTTETGVIAVSRPGEGSSACVGAPCHHVEVRLDALPSNWKTAVPGESAEGIVAVRSEALLEGYVTPGGIDGEAVRSGWFATGDCARLVAGRLELLGRLSSAINVAGVKVSPEEVEAALLEFPAVRSVLVAPVEDALAHQRIKAYVTPENVDLQELRRFCEARLSASKRPHYYEAVAALATTPSGKVIRRQRLEEDAREVNRLVPK